VSRFALLVCLLLGCSTSAAEKAPKPGAGGLCVTKGAVKAIDDGVRITQPTVRAVKPGSNGDAATLRLTYRGPSKGSRALKSGQMRRQLGLKLRAEDGCNLVYVMWRIEPKPGLEVSIKRNPGKHTHEECGTDGYTKIAMAEAPALEAGAAHELAARIEGEDDLTVTIDGDEVWHGSLGEPAHGLTGVAGLRTDNVEADVELITKRAPRTKKRCPRHGDPD